MFTGIIETVGHLRRIARRGEYLTLAITPNKPLENVILGESIAVDGCCLTVTRFDRSGFDVEVSPESIRSTIIGGYKTGRQVNLE
ncbi:MAG: riboflavin synthase, partial [Candidatus Zixiibacteriota bacterium]